MKEVIITKSAEKTIKKIKDNKIKEQIKKQIEKIIKNPEAGKPLRYNLKNERTLYIKPYRLIYSFQKNCVIILRIDHRKTAYK